MSLHLSRKDLRRTARLAVAVSFAFATGRPASPSGECPHVLLAVGACCSQAPRLRRRSSREISWLIAAGWERRDRLQRRPGSRPGSFTVLSLCGVSLRPWATPGRPSRVPSLCAAGLLAHSLNSASGNSAPATCIRNSLLGSLDPPTAVSPERSRYRELATRDWEGASTRAGPYRK